MSFKLGDRVMCVRDGSNPNVVGKVGVVVDLTIYGNVGLHSTKMSAVTVCVARPTMVTAGI